MGKQSKPVWKKISLKLWALIGFIGYAILDRVITWVVNMLTDEETLSYSWKFVLWIWEVSSTPISTPAWILVLLTGIALVFIGALVYAYLEPKEQFNSQDWQKHYTNDHLFGVDWFWQWSFGEMVGYPTPLCPVCSGELERNVYSHSTSCVSCQETFQYPKGVSEFGAFVRKAQTEILRRVRSGEYVAIVERQRQK